MEDEKVNVHKRGRLILYLTDRFIYNPRNSCSSPCRIKNIYNYYKLSWVNLVALVLLPLPPSQQVVGQTRCKMNIRLCSDQYPFTFIYWIMWQSLMGLKFYHVEICLVGENFIRRSMNFCRSNSKMSTVLHFECIRSKVIFKLLKLCCLSDEC